MNKRDKTDMTSWLKILRALLRGWLNRHDLPHDLRKQIRSIVDSIRTSRKYDDALLTEVAAQLRVFVKTKVKT